ncbi:MAG: replication endonuclease, partial [Pseudomonadales bacterium]
SNPAIRRAELMVRIRGFEEVASACCHVGEFYTMTTPSRMHSHRKNGKRNPKFDGTTPKEAHEYLCHVWRLIRAELNRREIKPYGFRVVEPHHDGTPHWHLLFFVPPHQAEEMASVIRYYTLREDRNEKGADKQRFKRVEIDPNKGAASGYIAKYISKNIDGAYLDTDLYGEDAAKSASKIEAWARTYDIRQFQQIGGPSVTVWRELRRLSNDEGDAIEEARKAADASDWAAFCLMMCGDEMKINARPIRPVYEIQTDIDFETGEVIPRRTVHGYRSKPKLIGLQTPSSQIRTRIKRFRIESRRAQPPP